jgi:thiamine pyrophosphate-dependent acetolactate synthase large subunit-like protein
MDFNPIDTVKMAEACGVQAIRSSNADQIGSAVRKAVSGNTSLVVGIPVHYADYRKIF